MANPFLRYLYAVKTHPRAKLGPKQFTTFEVPAAMVEASTELTPAARALGESVRLPTPCTFAGLSPEDVASIFAAFHRKEVHLAGGRFTRVPTVWNLLPTRRLNPRRNPSESWPISKVHPAPGDDKAHYAAMIAAGWVPIQTPPVGFVGLRSMSNGHETMVEVTKVFKNGSIKYRTTDGQTKSSVGWPLWTRATKTNPGPIYLRRPRRNYLRFGMWHPSETSRNHVTGITEVGVSVYDADVRGRDVIVRIPTPITGEWGGEDSDFFYRMNQVRHALDYGLPVESIFLVTGDEVGRGHDGEPLIKNVQIVREVDVQNIKARLG